MRGAILRECCAPSARRRVLNALIALMGALAPAAPARAQSGSAPPTYDFQWAVIGDPGNAPYDGRFDKDDPPLGEPSLARGRGAVNYTYRMSRLETTTAQWLEFVNLMAPQSPDPFSFGMPISSGLRPLIPPGQYELDPFIPNPELVPVIGVTWIESAMYCNWLHNGKPASFDKLFAGAYTLRDEQGADVVPLTHEPDALFWIPTYDEWIKAVHYDPDRFGEGDGGWWRYPYSSDDPPIPGPPDEGGQTSAGQFDPAGKERDIPLGAYADFQTPWGLWDASGGANEWTEEVDLRPQPRRFVDGSVAGSLGTGFDSIVFEVSARINSRFAGLRLASPVPSVGTGAVVLCAVFIPCRRRER